MALLGLATAPLTTQAQTSTSTTTTGYYQASKIVGSKVRSSSGEEIGEIKDVVLDNNGCMAYTVVSTGGTGSRITGQSKTGARRRQDRQNRAVEEEKQEQRRSERIRSKED